MSFIEETRDKLLDIRKLCVKELEKNIEMIEKEDGEINKLISVAEKMVMMQQVEKIRENPIKQQNIIKDIEEKFKMRK